MLSVVAMLGDGWLPHVIFLVKQPLGDVELRRFVEYFLKRHGAGVAILTWQPCDVVYALSRSLGRLTGH